MMIQQPRMARHHSDDHRGSDFIAGSLEQCAGLLCDWGSIAEAKDVTDLSPRLLARNGERVQVGLPLRGFNPVAVNTEVVFGRRSSR